MFVSPALGDFVLRSTSGKSEFAHLGGGSCNLLSPSLGIIALYFGVPL